MPKRCGAWAFVDAPCMAIHIQILACVRNQSLRRGCGTHTQSILKNFALIFCRCGNWGWRKITNSMHAVFVIMEHRKQTRHRHHRRRPLRHRPQRLRRRLARLGEVRQCVCGGLRKTHEECPPGANLKPFRWLGGVARMPQSAALGAPASLPAQKPAGCWRSMGT